MTSDAEELKNKKTEDKRQAFIERSGKKIHTVEFNKLLLSSVDKIHKSDRQPCKTAKNLNVSVASPLVLSRPSTKFEYAFSKIQDLRIDGGSEPQILFIASNYRRGPPPRSLHGNFVEARNSV